jgi:hypothetical protein
VTALAEELDYLGKLSKGSINKSPVENLIRMSLKRRGRYVHCGGKPGFDRVLPGVKVHVLGPPTLKQSEAIRKKVSKHEEYWHLQALAGETAVSEAGKLFADAASLDEAERPKSARWFVQRLRTVRAEQLLGIVHELDKQMNNTSVILLFEVGKQKLLFSGDAQIENWLYVLDEAEDKRKVRDLLKEVTVYKVGHHGSLNGTPKTVWGLFKNRNPDPAAPDRLRTLLPTEGGHHGSEERETEVPRRTLVEALDAESDLLRTDEDIPAGQLFRAEAFDT